MISARRAQLTLLFLLTLLSGASLLAAPTQLQLLLDSDNSQSTGCRVITSLGNVDGIDAIYTTTFDAGADGNPVVTGITAQTCATRGTVNFTTPVQIDPGGWAVGTNSVGNLVLETRIPVSALPNGLHTNMRWAFFGVTGSNQDTVLNNEEGEPILFPAPVMTHRRIVGVGPSSRTIVLDGMDGDWLGIPPLASGLASTGGNNLRFLGGVTGYATDSALFFYFSIQSNSNAPTAHDDGWVVLRNSGISISAPGILANDFDPHGKTLTAILISGPEHGTLTLHPDGSFVYHNDGSNAPNDGFRYKVNNGSADSNTARVSFEITDNRPPVASDDHYNVTHGGTLTVPLPGVLSNDHDPDGDQIVSQVVSPPGHGTVLLNTDGSFTYTHDGSNTTSDQFLYHDLDAFSASNPAAVILTVGPDAPPVANNDSYTTSEGGTLNAAGLPSAQSLFANDTDADSPTSLFTATITQQPAHGSVTLNPGGGNGGFTYVHDGSETLSDVFKYTLSDGIQSSNVATVTITVTPVNDPPVNSVPGAQALLEDGTLVFSSGSSNAITVSDPDGGVSTEQITLSATNGTLTLGSTVGISITGGANGSASVTFQGTLAAMNLAMNGTTYAPAANYFGPAQVTVTSNDLGNTGAGGALGATSNIGLTVTPVNDVPSFSSGGNVTVLEDSGAYSAGWASGISTGPANESGQAVNFIINNNSNPALFASGPTVSPTGVLSFTPAANANGSATITIAIHDDGGTANGGVDTSANQTFNINVTPVNDAPSFTKGPDQSVAEDSGAHTVNGWATAVSAGPPDEAGQTLIFFVGNNNNALFTIQPGIDSSGNLTYTLAANASGTAIVNVQLQDNGGITNGGVDTSAPQTFNIVVNAVDDAPVNSVPGTQTTPEDTPITFSSGNGNAITVSDVDANGGVEKVTLAAANGTIALGSTGGITITAGANNSASVTFTGTIAQLNTAMDGTVFTPSPDFNGSATLTITTDDQGNTGSGGPLTDTDPISITVTPVNDPPVVQAGHTVSYTENGAAVTLEPALVVTDVDSPNLQSASVVISGNADLGNDTLACPACGGTITGIYNSGSGVLQLTGVDTVANYQTVLRSVTYSSTSENPSTAQRGIDWFVTDTSAAQNANTAANDTSINVTAVNDAPVITRPATASTNEDTPLTFNGGNTISIADVDAAGGTLALTLGVANGTLTLSGTAGLVVTGNGTASVTASGTLANLNNALNGMTYASAPDYNGADTLNIGVNDNGNTGIGGSLTDSKSVAITINPVNDAPVAVADSYSVNEDSPLTVTTASGVLVNDTDIDTPHASLTAVLNVGPANASAFTLNADGSFNYTPSANFSGSDSFTYHAFDGSLSSNIVTVTITVNAVNDAPVITRPATASTNEDVPLTFNGGNTISIADVDAGAGSLALTLGVSNGTLTLSGTAGLVVTGNGTASITASGTLANLNNALNGMTYASAPDYNGADTLTIGVNDNGNTGTGGPLTDSKSVAITINPVNDAPVAVADSYSVNEDSPLAVTSASGVLVNDTDIDTPHASLTAVLNVGPANASAFTLNADGSFNYTPNANFSGSDSFTYHAFDGSLSSNIVTVTITVTAVNDAPVITRPANVTANEDQAFTFAGTISITDVDAGAGSLSLTLGVTNGTLTLSGTAGLVVSGNGSSSITASGTLANLNAALNGMQYLGFSNFNGADTLNIGINDNGNTGTGGPLTDAKSTAISVTAVNDPPVNGIPGTQTFNEDTSLTFSSGNANAITVSDVDAGAGNLQVTLTTTAGTITLGGTAGLVVTGNGTGTVQATGTIAALNTGLNGTVFTPTANVNGAQTIGMTTSDLGNTGAGGAQTDIDTINLSITAVNDAPVNSMPSNPSVNQDTPLTMSGAGAIQISDLDAGVNPVQVALVAANGTMTLNGTAGLSFTVGDGTADASMTFTGTISAINTALNGMQFTPNPGFFGSASIQITTNDQGNTGSGGPLTDTDTLTITVIQVNQPPVNSVPGAQTINEDTSRTFSSGNGNLISISDPDAGGATVRVSLSVSHGTLTLSGTTGLVFGSGANGTAAMTFDGTIANINTALNGLVYAPTANFNGSDTLTILTNDLGNTGPGGAMTDTDTVTINITSVDDAPVAVNDSYSVNEGATLTISIASLPRVPVVEQSVPAGGSHRRAVTPPPGRPGAGGPITSDITTGVLNNDTDIDTVHTSLTAILVTGPAHASSFTLNPNGTFTYVHDGSESTTDSFTYKANDGTLDSNVATATITINAVNDPPVNSVPGTQTINEDATLTFSSGNGNAISTSDADAGANNVTVTVSVTGGSGTLGAVPTGGVVITNNNTASVQLVGSIANINTALNGLVYTPTANFNGSTTLTMVTNDGGFTGAGGPLTDTDTVTINVTAVNDAPVITRPATVTATEDVSFTFNGGNTISIADVDAGAGTVTVTLSVTSGTLNLSGTTGLAPLSGNGTNSISATGTLTNINNALNGMTYTGVLNFNGSDTLNIGVNDNGNTGTGGPLSDAKSTSITVTAVDDAPVNTVPGTQTFNEDTTLTFSTGNGNAISVADIDAGAGNVTVTLTTTAGTMTFGSVVGLSAVTNNAATITGTGTLANVNNALQNLVFTPTLNINSAQTISLTTNDNSNTGTGGPLSDTDVINLTITAVNDAPTITSPASITATEDTLFTFNGGNALSVADVDAAAGTVNLTIGATNGTITLTTGGGAIITNNGTASVTASGTIAQLNAALTNAKYQGVLNFYGSDTVAINVNDNGNTGTGGALQANASITVTVNPVNDPPVAFSYCASGCTGATLPAQAGIKISFPAGKLGGTDEAHEVTDGSVVSVVTTPDTTCAGCTLVINANGSFDFTPPPSAAGTTVTFTYHVADTGFPGPGLNSTPATVTFSVAGPAIYFVKSAAVGAGDCKLGSECLFATAVTNIGVSTNAIIFMEDANSHTPGAVTLNSGSSVIGQGVVGASFDAFFSINASPGSGGTLAARPSINQPSPTLTNSPLTLNANSQARGFNINHNAGSGLTASSKTGLVISDMNITNSSGSSANFGATFTSSTGTFAFGTISAVSAGSGVNFNGTTSASTVTFGNISTNGGGAVTIASSGSTNFTFTNVTSTTGTAVSITTATGDFSFTKISSNGAAKGISVTALTGTGSFIVNGTGGLCDSTHISGTDCTGGTIQGASSRGIEFTNAVAVTLKNMYLKNDGTTGIALGATCNPDAGAGDNTTCNAALYFNGATTVSLDRMFLDGGSGSSQDNGINAKGVSGLSFTNSEVRNFWGNQKDAANIQQPSGTYTITSVTFDNNRLSHNWFITSTNTTSNITFGTCTISNSPLAGTGNASGITARAETGTSNMTIAANGCTFSSIVSNAVNWAPVNGGTMNATLNGGTATQVDTIDMTPTGNNTTMTYSITGVTITTQATTGHSAINVGRGSVSPQGTNMTETGTVTGNNITVNSSTCSTCAGIVLNSEGASGTSTTTISTNTIVGNNFNGIRVVANVGAQNMNLTMQGNTMTTTQTPANAGYGIDITSGGSGSDSNCLFLNFGDMSVGHGTAANQNHVNGSWTNSSANKISLAIFDAAHIKMLNYGGASDAAAAAYVAASNVGGADAFHLGSNQFQGGAVCP